MGESFTTRPKDTHLQPEITSFFLFFSFLFFSFLQKTTKQKRKSTYQERKNANPSIPPLKKKNGHLIPYQEDRITSAHARAHTIAHCRQPSQVSQSVCPGEAFFFLLFFLSFFFLQRFFPSFIERGDFSFLFFFFVKGMGGDDSKEVG